MGSLAQWVKERGYGLIIIDTLANVKGNSKMVDESMIDIMTNARRLSVDSECSVWLINHETKSTEGKSAQQRIYGAVQIAGGLDAGFSITRTDNYITVTASKKRGHMVTEEFHALFTYQHDDNGALDRFRFFSVSEDEVKKAGSKGGNYSTDIERCLSFLGANAGEYYNAKDVTREIGKEPGRDTENVLALLRKLHKDGRIQRQGEGKKGSEYRYAIDLLVAA